MQVLQWMDDAGIQPSNAMYKDILYFAQNCGGAECAAVIKGRVGMWLFSSIIIIIILTKGAKEKKGKTQEKPKILHHY